MHNADAAFLRKGNRQAGLGDRIHRGRDQGKVEGNRLRQARFKIYIARQNSGMGGEEKNVVKR